MKILSVHMENFGPYVNEGIDFLELNEQRLFLLEGKTGCGKSTIIDGVVFALYGKDTKGRDEGVRRNSAPEKQNARVTLEFEVEGIRYRITRSPQMKDSETGKTKKSHSVNLAEIDAHGAVIAGRSWDAVKEVEKQVSDIVRLNLNQFTRIVVLPQGQFSKFLRSKSEDRQALLEAIFPIDDWKAIQASVKSHAESARKQKTYLLDAAKQSAAVVANHTNTLLQNSEDEHDSERLKSIDEVNQIYLKSVDILSETSPKLDKQAAEIQTKQEELAAEKNRIETIEQINSSIKKLAFLLQEKKNLDEMALIVEQHQVALNNHHKAKTLHVLLNAFNTATSKVQDNKEKIAVLVKNSQFKESIELLSQEEIKQRIEQLNNKISILTSLEKEQKQLTNSAASLVSLERTLKSAKELCGGLLLEQHQDWASKIAQHSLNEGEPCLVCGSENHPSPASANTESSGALDHALNQAEVAEQELLLTKQKIKELEISVKEGRTLLGLEEHTDLPNVDRYKTMKSSFDTLRTLFVARDTLAASLNDSQKAWDDAEKPFGMDSSEGVSAGLLDSELEKKLTKEVKHYTEGRVLNDAELEKDDIKQAEGKTEVDVSKDKENLSESTNKFSAVKRSYVVALARQTDLQSSSTILEKVKDEYTNFASSVSDLQWVDEHLRGVNKGGKMKMDIVAWILRRWFEAALANANKRLAQIGSGRYSLEMTQTGKQDKKTGLNIGVIDALSDSLQPRSTASLSGGESFYISLALALGMSDVVSEEAGGITLGTLFIDEGFGTLDPETLDDVMSVIDDVGGNDRVIGLISHVESLKQRISSRISVSKEGDGTSTTIVVA